MSAVALDFQMRVPQTRTRYGPSLHPPQIRMTRMFRSWPCVRLVSSAKVSGQPCSALAHLHHHWSNFLRRSLD